MRKCEIMKNENLEILQKELIKLRKNKCEYVILKMEWNDPYYYYKLCAMPIEEAEEHINYLNSVVGHDKPRAYIWVGFGGDELQPIYDDYFQGWCFEALPSKDYYLTLNNIFSRLDLENAREINQLKSLCEQIKQNFEVEYETIDPPMNY